MTKSGRLNLNDCFLIMFVYLKLTHQIDWEWKWVLLPVWISVTMAVLVAIKEIRQGK